MSFEPFPKIARLSRGMVISEKIDGSNGQILIWPEGIGMEAPILATAGGFHIAAGSRSQFLTTEKSRDNFGFAAWVVEHSEELAGLGEGRHFGEWWGAGIQRRYGLSEKRFSLFNAGRWTKEPPPGCCRVVPVLYSGDFEMEAVRSTMAELRASGSVAAPGFMNPEGVVVFHTQSRTLYKKTFDKDDAGKEHGS